MHAVRSIFPRKRTDLFLTMSVGMCMSDVHVHYAEEALDEASSLQA